LLSDGAGLWTRGDAKDYEDWATLVGDRRWSWEGFLPYFRKTEHHHDPNVDLKLHGRNGPVHTASVSSSGRNYPLREIVKAGWTSLGVKEIPDVNYGDQLGIAEEVENRTYGKRTVAAVAYPLDGVTIMSETLVKRVIVSSEKVATGVELADGRLSLPSVRLSSLLGQFGHPKFSCCLVLGLERN
jgi:choline dehydrogenase-like flavoprotein